MEKSNRITAIILAGGDGTRFGSDIPKQFCIVNNKPIIVRTIEHFQNNSYIDDIIIVCKTKFHDYVKELTNKYSLNKVVNIVESGESGLQSVYNGVKYLNHSIKKPDYVIVHDAVRPFLSQSSIDDLIDVSMKNGNACLVYYSYDNAIISNDNNCGINQISRDSIALIQTPQMYLFNDIVGIFKKAEADNKLDVPGGVNALFGLYNKKLFFAKGSRFNIKITTKEDLFIYEALLNGKDLNND